MTEAEWLAGTDPEPMADFVAGRASDRKVRLFACACCRRVWHLIPPYHRRTVEVAERFADGLATREELRQSYQITRETPADDEGDFDPAAEGEDYDEFCVPWPSSATTATAFPPGCWDELDASYWSARLAAWGRPGPEYQKEREAHAHLLRDVFGNPFRPVPAPPPAVLAWNDGTAVKLAQAVYEERAFDRLPIVADALEEAGCADAELLGHLHGPGPHARGCWALDLLLGKE
jgi:hypothetical protein